MYLYIGMACNMFGLAMIELNHQIAGRQAQPAFLIFLCAFILFAGLQAWRSRPR
jgi:hypothetical protein